MAAAVGVTVALGQLIVATGVTVIALVVLRVLGRLALHNRRRE